MKITEDQALERLKARISYDFKMKDLAAEFDVSAAFMSMVLGGKKPMTKAMLDAISVRKTTIYETTE